MTEKVRCAYCGRTLAHRLPGGELELRHKGMELTTEHPLRVRCPHCWARVRREQVLIPRAA